MIDGLLSLARISRQELLNERVDLSALAHSIVEDLRQQYPRHKVECPAAALAGPVTMTASLSGMSASG